MNNFPNMKHSNSASALYGADESRNKYSKQLLIRQKRHQVMKQDFETSMTLRLKNTSNNKVTTDKINTLFESIEKDPKLVKMFVNEATSRGIYCPESISTRAGGDISNNPYGSGSKQFTSRSRNINQTRSSSRSFYRVQMAKSFYKQRIEPVQ